MGNIIFTDHHHHHHQVIPPVEGWGVVLGEKSKSTLLDGGLHFRTGPGGGGDGSKPPILKVRGKDQCGLFSLDDGNYIGTFYDEGSTTSSGDQLVKGIVVDASQIKGAGEESYIGFSFDENDIWQNTPQMFTWQQEDQKTAIIKFCAEVGLFNQIDQHRMGYAEAMLTYEMDMDAHHTTRLIEYTTIQTCSRKEDPLKGARCVHTTSTSGSGVPRKMRRETKKKNAHHPPLVPPLSSSPPKMPVKPPTQMEILQADVAEDRDLQVAATGGGDVSYSFPPTETSQFVHGLCVMGASTASATCTDTSVTYSIYSSKFGNGVTLWANRDYVVDTGVTSTDQCLGGIYLQPSKHKTVKKGSVITLTATPSDPNVAVTICGLAEYGHSERHGDWQNDLPALGFTTSAAFEWGEHSQMKAYCSADAAMPVPTSSPTAAPTATPQTELCFLVNDWETIAKEDPTSGMSCCFCIVPGNQVFDTPTPLIRRRRLSEVLQLPQHDHDDQHRGLVFGEEFTQSSDGYVAGICSEPCARVDVPMDMPTTTTSTR